MALCFLSNHTLPEISSQGVLSVFTMTLEPALEQVSQSHIMAGAPKQSNPGANNAGLLSTELCSLSLELRLQ